MLVANSTSFILAFTCSAVNLCMSLTAFDESSGSSLGLGCLLMWIYPVCQRVWKTKDKKWTMPTTGTSNSYKFRHDWNSGLITSTSSKINGRFSQTWDSSVFALLQSEHDWRVKRVILSDCKSRPVPYIFEQEMSKQGVSAAQSSFKDCWMGNMCGRFTEKNVSHSEMILGR